MIGTTMIEERVVRAQPERVPTSVPTIAAATVPAASGTKIFMKPLISTLPVHAQDAADDDRRDEQVEEVGRLREVGRDLDDRLGQQLIVDQRRRNEGREDGGRADVAQDRQTLADLGAA